MKKLAPKVNEKKVVKETPKLPTITPDGVKLLFEKNHTSVVLVVSQISRCMFFEILKL